MPCEGSIDTLLLLVDIACMVLLMCSGRLPSHCA
jgi:hypothetical protein